MENYSSKICTKCYSVQHPAARFCDNCGKAFAATAATDANISIATKTFLKRQVAETRPLFWLCIIIVGMLGVFGFAQAGLYLTGPAATGGTVSQKPVTLISKDQTETSKAQTVPTVGEDPVMKPNDALDLNESVFEMREGFYGSEKAATRRRMLVASKAKPETTKAETTAPTAEPKPAEKIEVAAVKPDIPGEKPAEKAVETGSGPKKYIRGPMGGCYYISPSGSKRYVDRGLCS